MTDDEIEIKLPKLGESIVSATIVQWFKNPGDFVQLDEALLEVSTDKVTSEIPSPVSGKIIKIVAHQDEELNVGAPLALIKKMDRPNVESSHHLSKSSSTPSCPPKQNVISPAVMRMAQEHGIDPAKLTTIPSTGSGGRLSKRDLENYLKKEHASKQEDNRYIKMSPMRKVISETMMRSYSEAPHATLINEVNVSKLMRLITENKSTFKKKYGHKLTITSFIAYAIGKTTPNFPLVNASFKEDHIILNQAINLGIAVSVDEGVLVPVIANCHHHSLEEIAQQIATLADRARTGKLELSQTQNSTFTMTNFGISGMICGIPIIRCGEVAILGVGAIQKKVIALEDDSIAIRSIICLSLTFDHRIFDGMYGGKYLTAIKKYLESDTNSWFSSL